MRFDDTENSGAQDTKGRVAASQVNTEDCSADINGNMMIPGRLDEIEAFMSRNLNSSKVNVSESPAINSDHSDNLGSRASTLEDLLNKHNSQLEELRIDRQLLLEENAQLKRQLAQLSADMAAVRISVESAPRDHKQSTPESGSTSLSHRQPSLPTVPPTPDGTRAGYREIVIHGIISHTEVPASALRDIAYATLATVHPPLKSGEITEVRILPSGRLVGGGRDSNSQGNVEPAATRPPLYCDPR